MQIDDRVAVARALLDKGRSRRALRILRKVTAADSSNAQAWQQLARALTFDPRTCAEAEAALARAQAIDPDQPEALLTRGYIAISRGEVAVALAYYERAVAALPGNWRALLNRALTLSELGRHDEAEDDIKRCVAIEPRNMVIHFNYGALLWHSDSRKALRCYATAFTCAPRPVLLHALFDALRNAYPALRFVSLFPVVLAITSRWFSNSEPLALGALGWVGAAMLFEVIVYVDAGLTGWSRHIRDLVGLLANYLFMAALIVFQTPELLISLMDFALKHGPAWLVQWLIDRALVR